jgi:hypothetical protein
LVTTPVLLVANAPHWLGTARIPRGLANAGFEVALLASRNSLAEKSRFVAKIGYLPDGANQLQWVQAIAAMVEATSPPRGWRSSATRLANSPRSSAPTSPAGAPS